jgi:hypothetical protein
VAHPKKKNKKFYTIGIYYSTLEEKKNMKRNRKPFVFPLLSAVLRNNNSTITFTHKLRSILLQTSLTFSPNPSPATS